LFNTKDITVVKDCQYFFFAIELPMPSSIVRGFFYGSSLE